jgi:hypothetical protein
MSDDLEKLLRLQVIDYDLGELERSKEYLPDMMQNLNKEIEEVQVKLKSSTQGLEEARIRQKNLELELATKESELQQFQQKMMSIKTNKEYDALVAEIDQVKVVISARETESIETIDEISKLEEAIGDMNKKAGETEDNNARQLKVLQQKIDSIGDKVAGKQKERGEVSSLIPRPTLSIYERVRRGKGGTAVVVVKKRACGSCYKALTPQRVQQIRRGDKLHTCESCGSLLFWDTDLSN